MKHIFYFIFFLPPIPQLSDLDSHKPKDKKNSGLTL